jgi:hypothetical protein
MKATKALKRLTKIETSITDITERFSQGSLHIREALQDAKAALVRAKVAVSSQASSKTAKSSKVDSKETPEAAKRNVSAAVKQAIEDGVRGRMAKKKEATANAAQSKKKAAAKKTVAARARKRTPIKKTAEKKRAPKKMSQAPREIPVTVETDPVNGETTLADVEVQTEPAAEMSAGN